MNIFNHYPTLFGVAIPTLLFVGYTIYEIIKWLVEKIKQNRKPPNFYK
jgi:hypothetical protein